MTQFSNNSSAVNNSSVTNSSAKIYEDVGYPEAVFIWVVSVIEIPVILLTLFAMCSLVKSYHAGSVYVINLIISDLIQSVLMLLVTTPLVGKPLWRTYKYTLMVGLLFMACIAFERYLLVCHPHWYRSHHTVKTSCAVSLIIWLVPVTYAIPAGLEFINVTQCVVFFIPYVIIILCFAGTCRGLSHAISMTSKKRTVVLGNLSLVLVNYTFLILPLSFTTLFTRCVLDYQELDVAYNTYIFCHCLLYLNPLADCLFYFFMRSDIDKIVKSLYCCRSSHDSIMTSANTRHQ